MQNQFYGISFVVKVNFTVNAPFSFHETLDVVSYVEKFSIKMYSPRNLLLLKALEERYVTGSFISVMMTTG